MIGPNANQVQFGDYTWSRSNKDGVTPLEGLKKRDGKKIKINYADSQIKGELKTNKDGEISGFVADHQVIEEQGKILIVGPRRGFGEYAKSVMQKTYGEEISEDDVKNKRAFFDTSLVPRIKFVKISEEAMADYQVKVVPNEI